MIKKADPDIYRFIDSNASAVDRIVADDPTSMGFNLLIDVDSPFNPLFNEDPNYDSAINYLVSINEPERANMLRDFKNRIRELINKYAYYLQTLSGLDSIYDTKPGFAKRMEERELVFETLESIDTKIAILVDRYQYACYDYEYNRQMVPINLTEFECVVLVSEIRKIRAYVNLLYSTGSETSQDRKFKLINDDISCFVFRFTRCRFDFTESNPFLGTISNAELEVATNTFKIIPGFLREQHKMGFLDIINGGNTQYSRDRANISNRFYTVFNINKEDQIFTEPSATPSSSSGDGTAVKVASILGKKETPKLGAYIIEELKKTDTYAYGESIVKAEADRIKKYSLNPSNILRFAIRTAVDFIDNQAKALLLRNNNVFESFRGIYSGTLVDLLTRSLKVADVFPLEPNTLNIIEPIASNYQLIKIDVANIFSRSLDLDQINVVLIDQIASIKTLGKLVLESAAVTSELEQIDLDNPDSVMLVADRIVDLIGTDVMDLRPYKVEITSIISDGIVSGQSIDLIRNDIMKLILSKIPLTYKDEELVLDNIADDTFLTAMANLRLDSIATTDMGKEYLAKIERLLDDDTKNVINNLVQSKIDLEQKREKLKRLGGIVDISEDFNLITTLGNVHGSDFIKSPIINTLKTIGNIHERDNHNLRTDNITD
jgi:hypothetical protein